VDFEKKVDISNYNLGVHRIILVMACAGADGSQTSHQPDQRITDVVRAEFLTSSFAVPTFAIIVMATIVGAVAIRSARWRNNRTVPVTTTYQVRKSNDTASSVLRTGNFISPDEALVWLCAAEKKLLAKLDTPDAPPSRRRLGKSEGNVNEQLWGNESLKQLPLRSETVASSDDHQLSEKWENYSACHFPNKWKSHVVTCSPGPVPQVPKDVVGQSVSKETSTVLNTSTTQQTSRGSPIST